MATVCLIPFRKLLLGITALGFYLLYPFRGLFGALTLAAFFLPLGKGGDVRPLWLVLVIVMLVVALTAWSNAAD